MRKKNRDFSKMLKARSSLRIFFVFIGLFLHSFPCLGSDNNDLPQLSSEKNDDLTELSLEDLMNIKITSVSKKAQRLSDAAAAVFVITREDIHRSGATSIPEALRMVPGLQVAKVDANKWAITARGFNGRFANKLLVLMDGRSVYTPIFSGVFWENIDTVLEDIDRIEVIRGPGASLWGANAVNGVINIITKPAGKSKGGIVSALAGSEEKGTVSLRYGDQIREDTPFRLYVKGFERDAAVNADGDDTGDDWRYLRGGFRLDHQNSDRDLFTLQGDIFDGTNGENITIPLLAPPYSNTINQENKQNGYNLLTRWTRPLSDLAEISLQAYYDHNEHALHLGTAKVDILDVEFQHRFPLWTRHDITWGLGYRWYQDHYIPEPPLTVISPSSEHVSISNAFFQDQISFFDQRLHLTLGSKFEYNDFTQSEIQPSARLLWKPNEKHSVWGSVSRAIRTPSRVERDAKALISVIPPASPDALPVAINFNGSDDFESEKVIVYEVGYRTLATSQLILDAALYHNEYKKVRQTGPGSPIVVGSPPAYLEIPVTSSNNASGKVYGFELAADWKPWEWGRFQTAYTYMEIDMDYGNDTIALKQDPRHQISLRAGFDLPRNMDLDLWYRRVGEVSDAIDGYDTIDARLGWKYSEYLEISITGQNLLDDHHQEFQPELLHTIGAEVQRGVYGKIVWKFN